MQLSPAQQPIQPQELGFGRLFYAVRDAVVVVDTTTGLIVLWNPAASTVFGYSAAEAHQMRLDLLIPEHLRPDYQARLQQYYATGQPSVVETNTLMEVPALHKSGGQLQVEMTLTPLADIDNGRRYIVAIVRDITERAQSALSLSESQARFSSAFTYAAIGVSLVALDGHFLEVNPALCEIVGYSEQELLQLTFQDITYADDLESDLASARHLLDGTLRSYQMEKRYLHKDGHLVWILLSVSLVNDAAGAPLYYLSQIQDISERKQAEQSLRESEERFRALFELSPDGIVLIDPYDPGGQWPIVDCNEVFCTMNGYTREELLDQPIDLVNAVPGPVEERAVVLERLRDDGIVYSEAVHRRKDGTLFPMEYSTSLINLAGRELVLGLDRDISQRKQTEAQLQSVNVQLASRVQELQEHTHELTILSDLSTMVQVCRTAEEAYAVIASSLRELLPHDAGSLSILHTTHDLLEPVATWGAQTIATAFGPDDCWALRRGQMYSVDAAHQRLPCLHVGSPVPVAYLCLPVKARGDTLGVLHLRHSDPRGMSEAKRHLAQTIASHLALVLANLRLQESLRYQSLRDALTGLYNRRYLEGALEREVKRARRLGQTIGVLMVDIDHYKLFNDTYGHSAGDTVLRAVGDLLRGQSRGEDIVCRYGGEEFGLVLPGASLETSRRRAENIRFAIKELQVQHGDVLVGQITCSIGVAAFPEHGASLGETIEAADRALYRAKHEGRDRVVIEHSDAPASEARP